MSEVLDAPQRMLLKTIFCDQIRGSDTSSQALSEELSITAGYVEDVCNSLAERGIVSEKDGDWVLTEAGRRQIVVVLAGGVFDIIHPGHLFTLSSAKKLGDVLIVTVATDKTVKRAKRRDPLNREERRVDLVGSLRMVDVALLGSETDMFEVVERVKPDVIALGYDQKHDVEELSMRARQRGLRIKVVRFDSPMPGIKSSSIIRNTEAVEDL